MHIRVLYMTNARVVYRIPTIQAAAGLVVPLDEALGWQVAAAGVPLTVVSPGSPYVLQRFEGAQALLRSYSTDVVNEAPRLITCFDVVTEGLRSNCGAYMREYAALRATT
jgi:hypothetical protein